MFQQQEAMRRADRILIVDDEELIVMAMRRYFEGLLASLAIPSLHLTSSEIRSA